MQTGEGNAQTIIYLLQEAEADFSRALADTKAAESEAQSAYERQMQDYKVGGICSFFFGQEVCYVASSRFVMFCAGGDEVDHDECPSTSLHLQN